MDIYERLDEMDADKAEMKAANLLHGLGFTKTMQMKQCKDFSGEVNYLIFHLSKQNVSLFAWL